MISKSWLLTSNRDFFEYYLLVRHFFINFADRNSL